MDTPFKDKAGKNLTLDEVFSKGKGRFKAYYLEFLTAMLFWLSFIPSHIFRKFVFQLAGTKIESGSFLHMGCRIYDPKNIWIGNGTIIGYYATLDGRDCLKIGNHVDIASEVMIYNSQHNIHSNKFEAISKPVVIEDYVFIGPRAIILPGVTLQKGSVVAAGAVVTKDVEENSIVAGVPAKEIGKRKVQNYKYRLGRARLFS